MGISFSICYWIPISQLNHTKIGFVFCLFLLHCSYYVGFPRWSSGKEPICQCRRHKVHGFDPWVGKIPWRRKWQPVSLPENSMNRGAYQAIVHRVALSWTWLKQLSMHAPIYNVCLFTLFFEKEIPGGNKLLFGMVFVYLIILTWVYMVYK